MRVGTGESFFVCVCEGDLFLRIFCISPSHAVAADDAGVARAPPAVGLPTVVGAAQVADGGGGDAAVGVGGGGEGGLKGGGWRGVGGRGQLGKAAGERGYDPPCPPLSRSLFRSMSETAHQESDHEESDTHGWDVEPGKRGSGQCQLLFFDGESEATCGSWPRRPAHFSFFPLSFAPSDNPKTHAMRALFLLFTIILLMLGSGCLVRQRGVAFGEEGRHC